jgi:hypothetical protein
VFIDVVDSLRCPADHEESTLVASIDRLEGRYIAQGSLGCPICRSRYPIRDFVAWFGAADEVAAVVRPGVPAAADEDTLARYGALLDARTPGAFFVLVGERARLATPLALAYDVHCIAVDPPLGVDPGDGVSLIRVVDRVPLAPGCVGGAAVDDDIAARPELMASVIGVLRPGGRIVAPASVRAPEGLRVLARDEMDWVAERIGAPTDPVPLRRASR